MPLWLVSQTAATTGHGSRREAARHGSVMLASRASLPPAEGSHETPMQIERRPVVPRELLRLVSR